MKKIFYTSDEKSIQSIPKRDQLSTSGEVFGDSGEQAGARERISETANALGGQRFDVVAGTQCAFSFSRYIELEILSMPSLGDISFQIIGLKAGRGIGISRQEPLPTCSRRSILQFSLK